MPLNMPDLNGPAEYPVSRFGGGHGVEVFGQAGQSFGAEDVGCFDLVVEAVVGAGEGAHRSEDGAAVLKNVDAPGGVGAGFAETLNNELQGNIGVTRMEVVDLVGMNVHLLLATAGDAAASGDDGLGEYLSAEDATMRRGLATAGEPVTDSSVCAGGGVGVVKVEGF